MNRTACRSSPTPCRHSLPVVSCTARPVYGSASADTSATARLVPHPKVDHVEAACCQDAAEIQVSALVASTADERQRLLRERAWIHAQLCNLVAAGGAQAANAFWDVVHVIVNGAVAIAFAAL